MRVKKISVATFLLAGMVALASCKKIESAKESITSAEDQATAESAAASTFDIVDDVALTSQFGKTGSTILPNGANLTFTDSIMTGDDEISYTIDFGELGASTPKGLLCNDGRYRAGIIRVVQKKKFTEVGCEVSTELTEDDNYYVGDGNQMNKLTGNFKGTRTGEQTVKLDITNGKVVTKNGTVEFYSTKTITRTVDAGPGSLGDEFEADGNGGGKNRNGEAFTWDISTPLVKKLTTGCATTFTKGVISLTNSTGATLSFNFDPYNDGACDKVVEVTFPNGTKQTFSLN